MRGYVHVADHYLGAGLLRGLGREAVDSTGALRFCGDRDLGWLSILFIDSDTACVKVEQFNITVTFKCF